MNFKIPFSLVPFSILRKISIPFIGVTHYIEPLFPSLNLNLKQADIKLTVREYLSMCIAASLMFFLFLSLVIGSLLYAIGSSSLFLAITISVIFTVFVFFQQLYYPVMLINKRIRSIEINLLPALQDFLIQLNSGIPLFNILVNISSHDYGELSNEFKKVVKEINAGIPQIGALDEVASRNPSLFFRRALWQIVNGMKAGSDMANVLGEAIKALSEEQLIQIQRYGSQLNPLAMFYMLVVIIMPSLATTFITIMSTFIALSEFATKLVFWGLFVIVLFFQIMFLGMIKSRRPNLLSEGE